VKITRRWRGVHAGQDSFNPECLNFPTNTIEMSLARFMRIQNCRLKSGREIREVIYE
jgi:hypothetical protein